MERIRVVNMKHYQSTLLCYSIFEMIFCAGPIFGWASLAYVLKKERYFDENCSVESQTDKNFTGNYLVLCNTQEQKLNIGYTVGFLTVGIISFPAGSILDSFGPRTSRFIGCVLFGISAVFWGTLSKSLQYLMYPAIITVASAGVFSGYAFLQVTAFFCDKHQSTIISIQNGAFNASAFILQLIKILYEAQNLVRLEALMSIYCGMSSVLVLTSTILLIPSKNQLIQHLARRNVIDESLLNITTKNMNTVKSNDFADTKERSEVVMFDSNIKDNLISHENDFLQNTSTDNQDLSQLDAVRIILPSFRNSIIENDEKHGSWLSLQTRNSVGNLNEKDGMKLTVFNVILHGSVMSIVNHIEIQNEKEKQLCKEKEGKQKPLLKMLVSGIYLWHLFFSSVSLIRLYFYVSTFENMLTSLPESNEHAVNKYINMLGIAQLVGLIFTPALGPYIDRNPKLHPDATYDDYRQWKIRRCAIALIITNSVDIVMGVTVLIPYPEAQILSITAHILLRGFFYSVHFTYFAVVFPPEHYGKLSCFSLLIAIIFGTMQYPLCLLVKEKLMNNPFWANVALLVITMAVYGQSVHLFKKDCKNLWVVKKDILKESKEANEY